MKKFNFDIRIETLKCPSCKQSDWIFVNYNDYIKFKTQNIEVDDAFPYLSKWNLERMRTGLCSIECADNYILNYEQI